MRPTPVTVLVLSLLLAACADITPTIPNAPSPHTLNEAVAQGNADYVARGIALAMGSRVNRARVHTALRASEWMDRKVLLHEFVRTEGGAAFLADAARALGASQVELLALVDQLGPMDLYVPFKEHRRSWRVADEVLVAFAFDGDAPTLQARDARGGRHTLRLADGAPKQPLVILHSAEPKMSAGPVATGTTALLIDCDPVFAIDCGGGGGSTPPPPPLAPGIYLTHFHSFVEDGWFGALEVRFSGLAYNGYNFSIGGGQTGIGVTEQCHVGFIAASFEPHQNYNTMMMFVPNVTNDNALNALSCWATPTGPHGFKVEIMEVDCHAPCFNGEHESIGQRVFAGPPVWPWGARIGVNEPYGTSYGPHAMVKLEYRP